MFNMFSVGVKQTGVYTHITGVSFYSIAKDIEKFFSSGLVTKYMVRRETWDTIKVHDFFLVELHYILGELLKIRTIRSRRRALSELKYLLETETWIKDTLTPSGKPFDFKRLNDFVKTPFPKQREFLEQYPLIEKSYHLRGILLDSVAGSGKAQPYSTKVKVPKGWKHLGELKVGEEVSTPDGDYAKITAVHPQGVTDVYRFHFEDGRWADSHPEHLWQVDEISRIQGEEIISADHITTTQDILNHFQDYEYQIPLVGQMDGLLEMGGVEHAAIAEELLISAIPIDDPVMELSYLDRFGIVRSMLELSGCQIAPTGIAFITTNQVAAKNFQKLVWSVGGIATWTEVPGNPFRIELYHPQIELMVENLLGPGLELGEIISLEDHLNLRLKITAVEKRPQEETLCISIDHHAHLYVIDDYIITHNTFTSLMWAHLLGDGATVVVCPLGIVNDVWTKQIKEHHKQEKRVWTSISGLPLAEGYDFYIVHYDFLRGTGYGYLKEFLLKLKKSSKHELKLILDESHNFNEIRAKQTQRLIELADLQVFDHSLPMSGTALKAQGSEIYPTLCLIDRHFDKVAREFFLASYGRNRQSLMNMLAHRIGRGKFTIPELLGLGDPPPINVIKVQIPGGQKYTLDAIKLEMQVYIQERMAFYDEHMPKYLAFYKEVLSSYEFSVQKHPKELADLQRYKAIVNRFRTQGYSSFTDAQDSAFCKRVEEDIEKTLKGQDLHDFRNVKSAVKYLGLKLRGEALGNVLGKARINAIKETIEHAGLPELINNVEKKTVIFTSYVDVVKLCDEYLRDKGFKPNLVYGEVNKDREEAVRSFGAVPEINPLIAAMDSLKEGIPLLMANQTIFLNAPYRDYEVKQMQARTWRTGQDSPCFYWLIDLDTGDQVNITTRSLNILEWSREQVDALLSRSEGHALLGDVTGEEAFSLVDEPVTKPLQVRAGVLSLFG
jgi:hypothetical protein